MARYEVDWILRSGQDHSLVDFGLSVHEADTPEEASCACVRWIHDQHPLADERIDPYVLIVDVDELEEEDAAP